MTRPAESGVGQRLQVGQLSESAEAGRNSLSDRASRFLHTVLPRIPCEADATSNL